MNILIIEDSKSVAHIISSVLSAYDFRCTTITPNEFIDAIPRSRRFPLYILNTSISRKRSTIFLNTIRSLSPNSYVVGVSTSSTWKEKVAFLNGGADDVLDYPFPMQELLARVQSVIRRPKGNTGGILVHKDLHIDTNMKEVLYKDREVELRRREFSLLEYLVRNKGRAISRAELLDHVWDYRRSTGSNTVDVHVRRLREKIKDKNLITTIHGFGYSIKKPKEAPKASLASEDE